MLSCYGWWKIRRKNSKGFFGKNWFNFLSSLYNSIHAPSMQYPCLISGADMKRQEGEMGYLCQIYVRSRF